MHLCLIASSILFEQILDGQHVNRRFIYMTLRGAGGIHFRPPQPPAIDGACAVVRLQHSMALILLSPLRLPASSSVTHA